MKFTDSHEWIQVDSLNLGLVGITSHAQKELGDIVYVELPMVGREVNAGQEVAVLESTKAAADVYSPVTGMIVEVNHALSGTPELVNQSPEKQGWLFKIRLTNPAELDLLMDKHAYQAMIQGT
jgi:glycine cleavage system H protein